MNQNEKLVLERINADLGEHKITVLRADGMYRHWRCQRPGTWNMGFYVVTWPGSLCFTGDMGDFLFQRTEDMVAFMKTACKDYGYAAQKCVAHDGLKEWSDEVFEAELAEREKDFEITDGMIYVVRQGKGRQEKVRDHTDAIRQAYAEYGIKQDALKAMYESPLWDGCDLPSCEVWTFRFLWCLHAIKWFTSKVSVPSEKEKVYV